MKTQLFLITIILTIISPLLYPENRLDDCNKRLYFNEAYIRESTYEQGEYLTGEISDQSFEPYDWKELSDSSEDTNRMFTIRADFYISPGLKDCELSIFLGQADYLYIVYINNELISKRGEKKPGHTIVGCESELLTGNRIKYDEINTIVFKLFPESTRKTISEVYIASRKIVEKEAFIRNLLTIHFSKVIFFLAIVLSIYFLFVFLTQNLKETKYLFFSLTSFFYALNTVNLTLYYNFSDVLLLTRISRIGFAMCAGFSCLFVIDFTKFFTRVWLKILIKAMIILPGIVFSVFMVVLGSKTEIDTTFSAIVLKYYIIPILFINMIFSFISIFKNKSIDSLYIFLAFVIVALSGTVDAVNLASYRAPYMWFIPYGYTVLVISIFFVLSKEQADIYAMSIHQQERLDLKNKSMSSMIEKIGLVSERLTNSYKRLDSIISHSVDVIQDYEKSNTLLMKDSVHHLDNVENIVSQIKNRIEESNRRVPKTIMSQTSAVEHITSTVGNMNTHIETTVHSSAKVNDAAKNLAELAGTSSNIIHESRAFITRISDYSKFITGILNTIEDITEKTKILSINAAVEAARAGVTGKGFSVVAQEIRKLAQQSQTGLDSSFIKIREMQETIKKSNILAEKVEQSLSNIIEKSRHSAANINDITRLIQDQKAESLQILQDVQSFSVDINTLKELTVKEVSENEKVKDSLTELINTFLSITNQLNDQMSKGELLQKLLTDINAVMDDNIENVEILQQCISEATE